MVEYAVVGSGIGGSSIASYLHSKGHEVALFEKESYLGGCSSTFTHQGFSYNTGATTLAGYQEGHIVKSIFDEIGLTPDIIQTDPAIVIIQNQKETPRYRDLETFLTTLEKNYPHPKHKAFWTLVYTLGQQFYQLDGYYYDNSSWFKKYYSLMSYLPLALKFQYYFRTNALKFIEKFYGTLTQEYKDFLEAQVLIVAQAPLKKINFFTAALSLGYTFNQTHYVMGGFSTLFEHITASIPDIQKSTQVIAIEKALDHFILTYKKREVTNTIKAKNIILNSTIYQSGKLFKNQTIKNYYKPYEKLHNHQSSFMLYMTIKSSHIFKHHYQLIQQHCYPHTLSKALFVSFSDAKDEKIVENGHYSITASIHTDVRWWEDKRTYKQQKKQLEEKLVATICAILPIQKRDIMHQFSATPKTFQHFIHRSQLGGNPITMKNFLPKLPSNNTPIKGLYHVGDSVYAAQGWPGVMLGVNNLRKLLDV